MPPFFDSSWLNLKQLLDAGAALAAIALAAFAGVQLFRDWLERRDRKRGAFNALWADYIRVSSLADSLAKEDLVAWVWQQGLSPDDFLPRDWGTLVRLLGEVGPATAALGALAYQALNDSAIRLRLLANALDRLRERLAGPPEDKVFRDLESQVKNGLKVAAETLDDAMRQPPRWLRLKKKVKVRDARSELGKALQRELEGKGMATVEGEVWKEEQEWLRAQYGMAHHDIWWLKGQGVKVGNWTLLLLGALVGVGKLIHDEPGFVPNVWGGWVFVVLSALATTLGALYIWDLYAGLVQSRGRAALIVEPLKHPVFEAVKHPGERNRRDRMFPGVVSGILLVGFGLVLWYFDTRWCLSSVGVVAFGVVSVGIVGTLASRRATIVGD